MGTKRRDSSSKLMLRFAKAIEDRETLIPCDACHGKGTRLIEHRTGTYRQIACKWCRKGLTDRVMAKMFERWLRIFAYNRKLGRCHD
jgi:hypothetical protein